jgi:hypothetical protein
MPAISTTRLTNGSRVELSTTDIPRTGSYNLTAQLFDAKGALLRSITVDTAFVSDGTTAPVRDEHFINFNVVGLSGGGFAIAYDDSALSPPGGASGQAEVHLYDAAGQAAGTQILATDNGPPAFPFPGNPVLTPTTSNGVLVTAFLADDHTHLVRLNADGSLAVDRVLEGSSSVVYEADGKVVLNMPNTDLGHPIPAATRVVLGPDLAPIAGGGIIETLGDGGSNLLIGGASADNLTGAGGDDTLRGGENFDLLSGGAGRDRFEFGVDGSIDQAGDFTLSEDTLALVDSAGARLQSATGVLTFWRATGVLTYDPDGDNGPAGAQAVAVLPGVTTLSAANLAPGYEPALLRIYNPINPAQAGSATGSHSDLAFGYGHTNFTVASADYNAAGVLVNYIVSFTDGTSSTKWFDLPDAQPWANLVADYDTQGRLAVYATYDDDGSHVLWRYDSDSTQPWQRIVDHYDANGASISREVVADDNTHWGAFYDVGDTQPWAYYVDHFATTGTLVSHTLYNADGSVFH